MIYIVVFGIIVYLFRVYVFYSGALNQRNLSALDLSLPEDKLPFVSIIIPAKDEEKNIERAVRSVAECDYPIFYNNRLKIGNSDKLKALFFDCFHGWRISSHMHDGNYLIVKINT